MNDMDAPLLDQGAQLRPDGTIERVAFHDFGVVDSEILRPAINGEDAVAGVANVADGCLDIGTALQCGAGQNRFVGPAPCSPDAAELEDAYRAHFAGAPAGRALGADAGRWWTARVTIADARANSYVVATASARATAAIFQWLPVLTMRTVRASAMMVNTTVAATAIDNERPPVNGAAAVAASNERTASA